MTDERDEKMPQNDEKPIETPAKIKLVYESEDGRFCVFEDAAGHITSVRASSLA